MTTAHRATYVSARGLGVGSEGSYSSGGVGSSAFSAKDLPSQLSLKRREGKAVINQTKEDLKRQLEAREINARDKRLAGENVGFTTADLDSSSSSTSSSSSSSSSSSASLLLRNQHKPPTVALSDKYNIDDDDNILKMYDDDDDDDDDNSDNLDHIASDDDSDEDSSSDDDDDELELLRELQKIKAEREEEAERKKEASTSVSDISAEVALSNPLMGGGGGGATGAIKRRWDDDVVFRNQAPGDPTKVQKRFINDTIRNTFHKKFLKKYIN